MKLTFMRYMDRYLGGVLVFLLVVFDRLRRLFSRTLPKTPDPDKVRTVCVQKFFGLGSILNSLPLLKVLRSQYPGARIVFITFVSNREILDIVKPCDEVITIRDGSFFHFSADCLRALFRLWRLKVDVLIDLEFFSRFSMLLSYLSGARARAGFFAYFIVRSLLLTHPVAFNHYKPISRAFLAMAEALGLDISDADQDFTLPEMGGIFENGFAGLLGHRPFVVVNPNASSLCASRKWPPEYFSELVRKLIKKYPQYSYVLTGASAEKDFVTRLAKACNNPDQVINLAGRTDIKQLMALLEEARLLISNDSGPVHLAAGYRTSTLVFFGPETPVLYGPSNPNARVLYKNLYCSPCINVLDNKSFEECVDTRCMRNISVAEALDCADFFLK